MSTPAQENTTLAAISFDISNQTEKSSKKRSTLIQWLTSVNFCHRKLFTKNLTDRL